MQQPCVNLEQSKLNLIKIASDYEQEPISAEEVQDMFRPFKEQHMIENLSVQAADPSRGVLFYNMLNQGRKRGKET